MNSPYHPGRSTFTQPSHPLHSSRPIHLHSTLSSTPLIQADPPPLNPLIHSTNPGHSTSTQPSHLLHSSRPIHFHSVLSSTLLIQVDPPPPSPLIHVPSTRLAHEIKVPQSLFYQVQLTTSSPSSLYPDQSLTRTAPSPLI